jgi:peptidoglycan L-alanyl-D-glutamate endopeptidase CwlK
MLTERNTSTLSLMPEFAALVQTMLIEARALGLNVHLFEGLRSDLRQDELYAQGRSMPGPIVTNARAGASYHQYGLAADFAFSSNPPTVGGKIVWTWVGDWQTLGAIGQRLGLAWLGAKGSPFPEAPHFQLTAGIPLNICRQLRNRGGLPSVWLAVRERLSLPRI